MIKFGSNNNDAAAAADEKHLSYIRIEPIVHHPNCRKNNNNSKIVLDNDSLLKLNSVLQAKEEQTRRRRRRDKLVDDIVERLETKMDQKIRNHAMEINKKIDQLSFDVSSKSKLNNFFMRHLFLFFHVYSNK